MDQSIVETLSGEYKTKLLNSSHSSLSLCSQKCDMGQFCCEHIFLLFTHFRRVTVTWGLKWKGMAHKDGQ